MQFAFVTAASDAALIAVLAHDGGALSPAATTLDGRSGGAIGRALSQNRFRGERGSTFAIWGPAGLTAPAVLLVGGGDPSKLDGLALEAAAAGAYHAIKTTGVKAFALDLSHLTPAQAARAAFAIRLAAWRFDRYRTTEKPERKPSVERVEIVCSDAAAAETAYGPLAEVAAGVEFTRALVAEPANVLFPASFADRCLDLKALGVEVEVLGEAELEKIGMRTLLSVGQGSERESKVVVMRWNGAKDPDQAPLALVGKGVCFDSGGLSLKPADAMEDMKWDMGGAGAVAGAMRALAGRKAALNVVGVLGLVENMPDGKASRPGDVVVSLSGQTIEIVNTDAEGRLVLADCLWWTQERYKPRYMIDFATLTGAMIIALGNDYAGLFSNDDGLAAALLKASESVGEPIWRLPLPQGYERLIDSPIADVKNSGGRPAGSITAGLFLQRFVNGKPWAHVDIAPTAWTKDSRTPTVPEGATGFGVRLIDALAASLEA